MRYTVYRLSPYPWEPQFAATDARALIAPTFTSNDLNAAKFACTLWARWFGEDAFVWDEQIRQWIFQATENTPLNAAKAETPAIRPAGQPFRAPAMR